MSRATLRVRMELLSDTVFGSGYRIPGGEDIALCQDEQGFPYLKASTLKGLLRESLENWLDWTGGNRNSVNVIFGEADWCGQAEERRLQLTDLSLIDPPADPSNCYDMRAFTQLENGVVKRNSLRTARCIRRGLVFSGEVFCAEEDVENIQNALSCIKWAGTMRSRGFGHIKISETPIANHSKTGQPAFEISPTKCIRLRLRTQAPLFITDLGRSQDNSYETRSYIPGSAIRGFVINALQKQNLSWFSAHKKELLCEHTRFLDFVPVTGDGVPRPTIKGFYESKDETKFQSVVPYGSFEEGLKRAKLGDFCSLSGTVVEYWSAKTDGVTRIQRNVQEGADSLPFQTRYLSANQEFEGYILLDDESIAPQLAGAFEPSIWLGADRYEGFGKCSVVKLEAVENPRWIEAYGYRGSDDIKEETLENGDIAYVLYLLLLSPLSMLNGSGDPCGLDESELARKLGVDHISIPFCSTSLSEYGSYNRTWQCREPSIRMYDRGSIFKLVCSQFPEWEKLQAIQEKGLGIRKAEGYGQIIFLRPDLFENLHQKRKLESDRSDQEREVAQLRRAKYRWVMENSKAVYSNKLSKSQVGTIQAECEKAIALGGNIDELLTFFDKNKQKGLGQSKRFEKIQELVEKVLDMPLNITLGKACSDSVQDRLSLLVMLFNYSRK